MHSYGFVWSSSGISAVVDDKEVWSVKGTAGVDLPGNAMQLRLIERPHDRITGCVVVVVVVVPMCACAVHVFGLCVRRLCLVCVFGLRVWCLCLACACLV